MVKQYPGQQWQSWPNITARSATNNAARWFRDIPLRVIDGKTPRHH